MVAEQAAPEATAPRVAVVVVTWNSASVVAGFLESLPAGLAGLDWTVTVADNASADDTLAVARAASPDCVIVQTGYNAGYAAAFNAGLRGLAGYDAVFIINPDVRLTPGCGALLYAALGQPSPDGRGRIGIAVPQIRDERGELARSLRREPSITRAFGGAVLGQRSGRYPRFGETVLDEGEYTTPTLADWATGAVMLMSRDCLTTCGPWDESFFLYSEETEYALRARDQGMRIQLVPEARVTHLGGESRVSPRLWSLLTVNKVRLYRKRHSAVATAVFWSCLFLGEAARAALGHPRSRQAVRVLLRPSTAPGPTRPDPTAPGPVPTARPDPALPTRPDPSTPDPVPTARPDPVPAAPPGAGPTARPASGTRTGSS